MRCSRVAYSLLLAMLAAAVIALGPADGHLGLAADLGLEQSPHGDTFDGVNHCQPAADWHQHASTDGQEPSTAADRQSDALSEDGASVAAAEEGQSESGSNAAAAGYPTETGDDLDHAYGQYDQGDGQYLCPKQDQADEAQVTEGPNADEDYADHHSDCQSDRIDNHEDDYLSQGDEAAEVADTEDHETYQSDRWSESAGYDSQYQEADESRYSYQSETDESESAETGESDYSYEADTADSASQEADDSQYSYQSETDDSENAETGQRDYSYEADTADYGSQDADESQYSYQSDTDDSQNEETGQSEAGYQDYSEADPEQDEAYTEDEEEYTYQYEYSDPEEKYGHAAGLSGQEDDAAGDASEDRSECDYGSQQGQEGESGEVQETQSVAPADGEYVDPCQPGGYQGQEGDDTLEGTTAAESEVQDEAGAESAVWGVIVSWASRSLEELGDACHSLSRQISVLGGRPWTVGSRGDAGVN